jgi:hypothetical protein
VRLVLWTPRGGHGWWGALARRLEQETRVACVAAEPEAPPVADVHVYDVADDPAHGFVYRALRREPGVVLLGDWNLHRLVHAETAGRGDATAYRREARRDLGERGSFVADQVLAGRGGALPALLPLNGRVLEASLGLATTAADVDARARARLGARPVVRLPPDDPEAAAKALLALARVVLEAGAGLRREAAADFGTEGTLLALALDEVRPAAHALGLARLPPGVRALLAELLPDPR